jgi:glycosyltransferase involved in cell wall biosynthesis
VSIGSEARKLWDDNFADEGCVLLPSEGEHINHSQAFAAWCQEQKITVVAAQHNRYALAALPHLPTSMRAVHICMDLFSSALRFYQSVTPAVDALVAATPRQCWELLQRSVPRAKLSVIPFAARVDTFGCPAPEALAAPPPLHIAWVARLNHLQKGIGYVPDMFKWLDAWHIPYVFHVVGEGSHRAWLEQQLAEQVRRESVRFYGRQTAAQVAEVLHRCHAYILPTRYEGFGISIVEAMAAACVPVVTRLTGVTDWMMEHGTSGMLCTLGDSRAFATALMDLQRDPARLLRMRQQAQRTAQERFSETSLGQAYAALLSNMMQQPATRRMQSDWRGYKPWPELYQRSLPEFIVPGRMMRRWLDWREISLARNASLQKELQALAEPAC